MTRGTAFVLPIALLLLCAAAASAPARDADLSSESRKCLRCHQKKGIVFRLQDGDTLETFVDPGPFKASVHNILACTTCHTDFARDAHPARRFRDRAQYRAKSSAVCTGCHPADRLGTKAVHASLLARPDDPVICTDCHDAHAVAAVTGGKFFTTEQQYCMSCHRHELFLACRNGEKVSLKLDKSQFEGNAHARLRCSDCHFGFSSDEHPQRNFRSRRDYIIAASESCRRCHFDKYTKTLDSVHYTILAQGNLKAPVCNDCHGSHAIAHVSHGVKGRVVTTQKCRKCHPEVFDVYAKSVHGKALFNEHNQDVPVCIDCHTAHDIDNPLTLEYHERIPQMCGNCHANPAIAKKYGMSTEVLKAYLSDFHGVTLGLYRKQREALYKPARPIAVCTDCHGTHNISSTISSDPANVRANLVKRCQKCHKDANRNFPDAWLSHYKPSLAKFPLIFIVDTVYTICTPIMAIGLILQVLLHIWRYAVNR